MAQPDYIVIGAGTVGVSLAYGLQKRGQAVCV
ncbi:MAG: FAD-binding oxidoreductase, partial [Rhodobacteraceae bacterium]|nr:FAD-binding oxidoreductase [Paracoccaceae bacterium]